MAALIDVYTAATNPTFQQKCTAALWVQAQGIITESVGTANHTARLDWAVKAFTGKLNITPQQLAVQFIRGAAIFALADPTTASDALISAQAAAVLNDLVFIG